MSTHRWTRSEPIRADADSVFAPVEQLPDASIGDSVEVEGHDEITLTGTIVDRVPRGDQEYFRLRLDDQ